MKKLGIVLLILGIASVGASIYIKGEVEAGKEQVSSAQDTVDKGNSLFSLNPATEDIGKELSSPIQKKIDQGNADIETYEAVALWSRVGGAILIILGLSMLFIRKKK
jgi:hypothetical protein